MNRISALRTCLDILPARSRQRSTRDTAGNPNTQHRKLCGLLNLVASKFMFVSGSNCYPAPNALAQNGHL
jgi:hypothetical protein